MPIISSMNSKNREKMEHTQVYQEDIWEKRDLRCQRIGGEIRIEQLNVNVPGIPRDHSFVHLGVLIVSSAQWLQ